MVAYDGLVLDCHNSSANDLELRGSVQDCHHNSSANALELCELVQDCHNSSALELRQSCTKPVSHRYHDSEYILGVEYFFFLIQWKLRFISINDANFVITGSTRVGHNDNHQCGQDSKVGIMIFPGSLAMMQ